MIFNQAEYPIRQCCRIFDIQHGITNDEERWKEYYVKTLDENKTATVEKLNAVAVA